MISLVELADRYENSDFLEKDPSKFMHRYKKKINQEIVAFISANLAFGRREQILLHIEQICTYFEKDNLEPFDWVIEGKFYDYFPQSKKSFYRMYSFLDMRIFFESLQKILMENGSLESFFKEKWEQALKDKNSEKTEKVYLHQVIAESFPEKCALICYGKNSAAKKLNMFLRWMVRDNSPVDLGLWNWYKKCDLIIPLDTHVMQQATELALLEKTSSGKAKSASLKTALELTEKLSEYFPGDPVRGDYALFGLGVNKN